MDPLTKPRRVRSGDTVAVVSPSFGAVGRWPHRVKRATAYLESLDLKVRVMPNAARSDGWASAPPGARVADLHEAFGDDEVGVVLAGIGGNFSNELLPLLDFDLMRAHPKVFQGYSDITVLHWAFAKHAGLGTFHGPALVPELGEFPRVLPHTDRYLRAAWFGDARQSQGLHLCRRPAGDELSPRVCWPGVADVGACAFRVAQCPRARLWHGGGGWC